MQLYFIRFFFLEFISQKENYQAVQYCFLFMGIDNIYINTEGDKKMKNHSAHNSAPNSLVRNGNTPAISKEKPHCTKPSENDREFIRVMNEFVAKNGTITDDEYFRVL